MGKNEIERRKVAKDLRDQIELISGVAKVDLSGYRKEEIVVEIFPKKLNHYQVTVDEVAQAIKGRNMNLSGGKLETESAEFLIRTKGEFENIDDIKNVVVRSNNTGANVKITQIGEVSRVLSSSSILHRAQRENAIYLNVKKKFSADVIETTEKVKDTLKDFFSKDRGIDYTIVNELAFYVKRRLGILTSNGLFGFCLVILVLLFFLNLRVSIITALGAPIAFLTAFALMESIGVSFNLISMFGLILVLGMLVDDAIIVSEHFYQHIENGMPPKQAAVTAAYETIQPVTATILTTILAFGSIFFMGGIMGKFLWPVPAVVIICLIASWLECFFILPSHLADFAGTHKKTKSKRRWYDPLRQVYEKALRFCLKRYIITSITFIGVLIASLALAKSMRFELFPGDDSKEVTINITGKVGTPLAQTEKVVIKIEEALDQTLKKDELRAIRGIVGSQIRMRSAKRTGGHYSSFILYLTEPTERKRSTDEIIAKVNEQIKNLVPGYEVEIDKLKGGPPRGSPIEIQLKSDSLKDLKKASKEIENLLNQTEGVVNASTDFEDGKTQLIIDVDEEEVKRLGLSTAQVATAVRRVYSGDSVTQIRESGEDIEVILRLDEFSRSKIDILKDLYILNNRGQRIQLSRLAKIEKEVGSFIIRRLDRKRTISVTGNIDKGKTTPVAIAKKIRPQIEKMVKGYPGLGFTMGGENKDTVESMLRLAKAAIIALGAIFFVLVAIFSSLGQPIVILSAIPLGLIGVIITFKMFGMALGFMAMMGVIGLVGVVVNDSIVLVNFINKRRESGKEVIPAILEAAKSRFRPIILTSFTTVASLLPIAHGGGDPFLKPMALSFAWGLMFSTVVTLFFIPCAYLIYDKLAERVGRLFFKMPQPPI
ncbi:MAG: efflux RND transporter permease subunit, partial [Bacteriovoracales bacterium]|nr:efflux RND transporter permease subunit [Bacteriovoracales bacterium]